MKKGIIYFLVCIVLYHILHTVLSFGVGINYLLVSGVKDIIRIAIVLGGVILGRKCISTFIREWKWSLLLLIFLISRSLGLSMFYGISPKMMLVGLKYDVYPLVILCTSIFLGVTLKKDLQKIFSDKYKISNIAINIFFFILGGGIVWHISKLLAPDLFMLLGYGPIGDYVLGANPPLLYRTGPGGMERLQGLFAGPNNYGFFLVSVASLVVGIIISYVPKTPTDDFVAVAPLSGGLGLSMRWFLLVLFFVSLVWTISRGAWIGVLVQLFLLVYIYKPTYKKYLIGLGILGVLGLLAVAQMKAGSTMAHIVAWFSGWEAFLQNPWGYGLGSAGPAVHREGIYLPENHYLQILLDIGIPGLVLRCGVVGSIAWTIRKKKLYMHKNTGILIVLFSLGLIGLLTEGLFLHVFEDSMVNYLFFVSFGLVLGSSIE